MAEYNPAIALGLAEHANFAYFREAALKRHFTEVDFTFIVGKQDGVDTQAFMITHEKGVVLAFRGTQQWEDVGTDLWLATPTPHHGSASRRVHGGFWHAYEAVHKEIWQEVGRREPSRVFVTGHSLGGALATLAALDIAQDYSSVEVTMYNFGSPRVGDWGFAEHYNGIVEDSHRVVAAWDGVPHLPPLGCLPFGYRHIGRERRLKNVALPFLHHDLVQSYLPQLSDLSDVGSYFDD